MIKVDAFVRLDPAKAAIDRPLYRAYGDCQYTSGWLVRYTRPHGFAVVHWPGIGELHVHPECLRETGG